MMAPNDSITKSKRLLSLAARLTVNTMCSEKFSFVFRFSDATTQLLSGCLRDFRNKPYPTRARIEYYRNTLTVLFHNGMSNGAEDYEMCLRAEGVILPKNGYFGVSAATGGLADDHDVFHFLTTSLHAPGIASGDATSHDPDAVKLRQEYQDYQKKIELQKEEYRKEHPEEKKDEDLDDWFETDNQRELRQIYQSQKQMVDHLRDLSRKMDEVVGRQERTLGLLSAKGGAVAPQQHHQGVPPPTGGGGFVDHRNEINTILTNQNAFLGSIREIRSIVGEVKSRTDAVLQNQAKQPTAQIHSAGYDVQSMMTEMRDGMNQVKQGIAAVSHK